MSDTRAHGLFDTAAAVAGVPGAAGAGSGSGSGSITLKAGANVAIAGDGTISVPGAAPVALGTPLDTDEVLAVRGGVAGYYTAAAFKSYAGGGSGSGTSSTPSYATAYTSALSSTTATTGGTVTLTLTPASGGWPAETITPASTLAGTFSPATISTTAGSAAAATATFTPSAAGTASITSSASPAMTSTTGALTLTVSAAQTLGTHALAVGSSGSGKATVPYSASLVSGTFLGLRARVNASTWTPSGGLGALVYFWDGSSGAILALGSGGTLHLVAANDSFENMASSIAIPVAAGSYVDLYAAINSSNAAQADSLTGQSIPANVVRFFYASGGTWTAFGADAALTASGTLKGPAAGTALSIGTDASGNMPPANALVTGAQVRSATAAVLDVDFSNQTAGATSFTAASGQTVTVVSPGAIQ